MKFLRCFTILLVCFHAWSGYSQKEDFQALKKVESNYDYLKLALAFGEKYFAIQDYNTALEFIKSAEQRGKKMGGNDGQRTIILASAESILRCCYEDPKAKELVLSKIQSIIDKDKNKLFSSRIKQISETINSVETDPLYLGKLYQSLQSYFDNVYIEELKSSNATSRQAMDLRKTLEDENAANSDLRKSLDERGAVISRLSITTDSITSALSASEETIKLAQQKMEIDSLETLRRNDILQQQMEVIQLKEASNQRMKTGLIIIGIFSILLAFFLFKLLQLNRKIKEEKARSEDLLLNILPSEIAKELKAKGHVETQFYEDGTILFVDIVGFSRIARESTPKDLVSDLNECFMGLDNLAQEYKIEKIKTIGDAYMCVSGIPIRHEKSTHNMVEYALASMEFLDKWNIKRRAAGLRPFEVRMGIHTGSVAAGVVGKHKFCFDVWGNSVNIASRLESSSKPGEICISQTTKEKLGEDFEYESVGLVEVKNMESIQMYFVHPKFVFESEG